MIKLPGIGLLSEPARRPGVLVLTLLAAPSRGSGQLPAHFGGYPGPLGASRDAWGDGFHDLSHARHASGARFGDGFGHHPGQLTVVQLGGQVPASTSPSACSAAACSARPAEPNASAASRRFFASLARTFSTSSSDSSRAACPATSSLVIAVSALPQRPQPDLVTGSHRC